MTRGSLYQLLCVAIVCAALAACAERGQETTTKGKATARPPAGPPATDPAGDQAASPATERALRITVETSLVVDDLDRSVQTLRAIVTRHGGYVASGSVAGEGDGRSASIEARVPSANIGALRAELAQLGRIDADAETVEDVTEQRADLGARLRNARAQEQRLLGLLAERTGTLADVVAVEKELGAIRETIERLEAQSRTLEGQIALATVKVTMRPRSWMTSLGAGARIARGARIGVHTAWTLCVGLVVALATAGPTLLIVLVLAGAVLLVRRRLRRRLAAAPPKPPGAP